MCLPLVATLARKKCVLHWLHSVCPGAPWVCLEMFETRTPRSCPNFLLLCQEDPSLEDVGRSQMLSLNRSCYRVCDYDLRRKHIQTSCIYQWVNLSSVCYNRFQMLRISSNFETCHVLEATTVMKTHLGCCSIKWIHIGFLLLAIWRSYLTTSLQNVCVCACYWMICFEWGCSEKVFEISGQFPLSIHLFVLTVVKIPFQQAVYCISVFFLSHLLQH